MGKHGKAFGKIKEKQVKLSIYIRNSYYALTVGQTKMHSGPSQGLNFSPVGIPAASDKIWEIYKIWLRNSDYYYYHLTKIMKGFFQQHKHRKVNP